MKNVNNIVKYYIKSNNNLTDVSIIFKRCSFNDKPIISESKFINAIIYTLRGLLKLRIITPNT